MEHLLRPVRADDHDFLYRLYASTRPEVGEFGWPPEQQQAFLRMQFNAQQRWYQTAYPAAEHSIITAEQEPIGRVLVLRDKDSATLVDISILPEYRRRGIGSTVIRELIRQSSFHGKILRLRVLRTNVAQRLYLRLGFLPTGEDDMYLHMATQTAGPGKD
ncbi:MAG TPA: GNAT family N-acetyltransferase [Candidatus Angelobacter sp.]|nr:GNAT family N-acetyltransferase [Candidatus Angelobacter sp.]